MDTSSVTRRWVSSSLLVLLCISPAATTRDAAVPAVACPCASEYATAVAEYNKRPGDPLIQWTGCHVEVSGTEGLIGYAAKPAPEPPGAMTVILVSKGRWGYGHGIQRRCEAWAYNGLAGDWGRPPLGEPTHGGKARISEDEIKACTRLIRETAKCPE